VNRPNRKWILQQPINSPEESFSSHKNDPKISNFSEEEKVTWWTFFSVQEKRNIFIYMIGMMLYKFGLEAFNGSIVSLRSNRYDRDAFYSGASARTFERVGLMVGLNQACQCIGSILIAPLIKRWPTRTVLSVSILLFSLCTALLMIIDAATGGKIKPSNYIPMYENDYRYYGNYPTNLIIPIYCIAGIAYGMVELIRRIIPRDIVGSDEEKLKRMDALVHTFYELADVSGALLTGLVLIPRLGNNYAFLITPILFTISSIIWLFINSLGTKTEFPDDEFSVDVKSNYLKSILKGFYLFFKSVYLGGKMIFSNRKYIWLFPCYSLTLYVHRYIENGIAPQIAKRYLRNSAWSQIIVGGSNFGELLGALTLLFTTKKIHSPLFWLRFDCILLFIVWYIPFYNPSVITVRNAWIVALSFIPFGFGASGNDVSLNAHIQSNLSQPQLKDKDVSTLSSVMAFLYSSYIIIYAICNPLLGKYIDSVYNNQQTIRPAFIFTVGVQITIIAMIVFLSTFIPKGSFKFNLSLH
jgi:MFS family permease